MCECCDVVVELSALKRCKCAVCGVRCAVQACRLGWDVLTCKYGTRSLGSTDQFISRCQVRAV